MMQKFVLSPPYGQVDDTGISTAANLFARAAFLFASVLLFTCACAAGAIAQNIPPAQLPPFKYTPAPAPGSILGDSLLQRQADEGLIALYNMEFARADSIFKRIGERYPNHPIEPFLQSLVVWWQILPTLTVKDTSHDKQFMRFMDEVIRRSDRMLDRDKNSFDGKFFKGGAYGFRGRLLSDREEWLKAAQDGRRALDHIFEIAVADTSNADLLFGVGVYDYFGEAVPEKYPLVKPLMLFFPDADKQRGIQRLTRVAEHGRFIRAEAAYFLLQINLAFDPDYQQSLRWVGRLRKDYPGNALFHLMEGRVYFRWGQFDRAAVVFGEVIARHGQGAPGYIPALVSQAHYYAGREAFRQTNNADALHHFQRVAELEKGYRYESYFRVNARLRAGMVLDMMGRRRDAEAAYREVIRMRDHGDSRDEAKQYLRSPYGRNEP